MSEILEAREARSNHINDLMQKNPHKTIAVLKLNVVGKNKNPINMRFICLLFDRLIKQEFDQIIINSEKIESVDGDYIYYIIDADGSYVKEKTIYIEDNNYLGRLVDIDVYNDQSISRQDLACEMRRCLLCDEYAHICARDQRHSQEDIYIVVQQLIEEYLTNIILNNVMQVLYEELEMYPKFGLVSKIDSGCHQDMDYETFVQSMFAIKPYLKEYILYGVRGMDHPLELQQIGIQAEKAMFEATNNVNTQKGLIFALGIFLPALSKAIVNNRNKDYIYKEIKRTSIEIIGDYYKDVDQKKVITHGDQVYLDYGVKGIRGQALDGFKKVLDIPSYKDLDDDDRYHEYMIDILRFICDTTVIYKHGFKTMKNIQADMDDIRRDGGYNKNKNVFKKLSDDYKNQGISPGGASDLLVIKMIYERLSYLLCHTQYCGI